MKALYFDKHVFSSEQNRYIDFDRVLRGTKQLCPTKHLLKFDPLNLQKTQS